jgi:hypothetical protein
LGQVANRKAGPYRFWYRESPRYLDTGEGNVTPDTPPLNVSGMNMVYLDTDGRLHWFLHVPQQREQDQAAAPNRFDWSGLFHEAGFDITSFQQVTSTWVPQHAYDERLAWDGTNPARPDQKVHIEAAAFRGQPVYFETIYPWDQPTRQAQEAESNSQRVFVISVIIVFLIALVGSALIARRNLRLGRSDIRGALRLGFFLSHRAAVVLALPNSPQRIGGRRVRSLFVLSGAGHVRRFLSLALVHSARAVPATTMAASHHFVEPGFTRRVPRSARWPRPPDWRRSRWFNDPCLGADTRGSSLAGPAL